MATAVATQAPLREDFAKLLDESFGNGNLQEGSVIKGTIVGIEKDVAVIELGTPSVGDFNGLLDRIIDDVKDQPRIKINLDDEGRERLVHAARGLTLKEAENVFAKTIVVDGKLDAADVSVVFSEKQQISQETMHSPSAAVRISSTSRFTEAQMSAA